MVFSLNSYTSGLLDDLPSHVQEALLKAGKRIAFADGQLVQSRGSAASELVIVLSGAVRMMTIGDDGSELLSAVLGPGQQFNEVTLFAKATRTHDGVAVGNTELLVLNASAYQRCAERHPEIVQALLVSNVQRVHQLVELLNDLRALPKSVVLARILYKNACNVRGGGRVNSVDLDVAQDDIAKFLGVSRAYLNKAFAQLSDLGLIAQAYRKVRVLDMRALDKWIRSNMTYYTVDESKFAQQ